MTDGSVGEASSDEGLSTVATATAPEGDIEIDADTVLPAVLRENAETHPDETALRWKRYGIWQEYDWEEYYERVGAFALGLEDLGFEPGDVLFTLGDNRPHHLWAWLGAQVAGGFPAPNYEEMLPDDVATQLNLIEARAVYAEDQEAVDKILSIADDVPSLETVVYRDPKGMFRYDSQDPLVIDYETVEERGREKLDRDLIDERIDRIDPDDVAMLSPTSGTTGAPKRTKLSHYNFVNFGRAFVEAENAPDRLDYFSYLPMAWVGEQQNLTGSGLMNRWVINFPEREETVMKDLREIGPEFVAASPTLYERQVADVKAKIENTTPLKRWVYETAMDVGYRRAEYVSGEQADETPPLSLRLLLWLSYWVCYRPILDKMGLKQARRIFTGGAPLGEEHFQFFHALGLDVRQAWGQTEACGVVSIHRPGDIRKDTMGQAIPNTEVGELPSGELVIRGPSTTSGYYNQPEKTAEAIRDGWIMTDDFGTITDDGHVKVFDRMDDVIEMTDGETVAPVNIETRLKFNPYVKEAMVVGDDRPYLTAILNIRFDNVAEWADQQDLQYNGYQDLSQHPAVLELLSDQIEETNAELDVDIERFVSLFKEFDPDDDEITHTRKLRREPIKERYDDLIAALYEDVEEVEIEIPITYQDGRQELQAGTMPIVDLEGGDADA